MNSNANYFVCLFLLSGCLHAAEVRVAVASNFKYTLQKLAADFNVKTGHELVISSASSGKLYAQIIHGAPYDVFMSADEERADLLMEKKIADTDSAYVYALGKLVLLSNLGDVSDCRDVLLSDRLKRLAMANPDIAPYGLATKQALQKLRLWRQLKTRLVMGENIAQTLQFVTTKNAEAGFVARSIIDLPTFNMRSVNENSCIWYLPDDLYSPIKQKVVMLNAAKEKVSALSFMRYVRSPRAKEIIRFSGYDVL